MKFIFSVIFITNMITAYAIDIPMEFENKEQQRQYQQLLEELRCLVCQNQSLADSNADLAQDLRFQVYNMVDEGKGNQAIKEFLVQRYGDFVLYRPPVNAYTYLLWFGPFMLLFIAIVSVFYLSRAAHPKDVILKKEEQEKLSRLFDDTKNNN